MKTPKFPVPFGFTWNIVRDTYANFLGHTWNCDTNETVNENGLVIQHAELPVPANTGLSTPLYTTEQLEQAFRALIDNLGVSHELAQAKRRIVEAVALINRHKVAALKATAKSDTVIETAEETEDE